MNKVIARHKFWLHQTECNISTAYVEVLHEYQTVVMYMDDFEEIDSYTTYSRQKALELHESPDDCKKAITSLKKLKVYFAMNDDTIDNFADVWFRVQHECDMYEEMQDSNELTYQSYIGAKNWLEKWRHLYIKYEDK